MYINIKVYLYTHIEPRVDAFFQFLAYDWCALSTAAQVGNYIEHVKYGTKTTVIVFPDYLIICGEKMLFSILEWNDTTYIILYLQILSLEILKLLFDVPLKIIS